jgi:hypothetical protein
MLCKGFLFYVSGIVAGLLKFGEGFISIKKHLQDIIYIHEKVLKNGYKSIHLAYAIVRKYPNTKYEWVWQYVFPATKISTDPRTGIQRRHHLYDTVIQKNVK